MQLHSVQVGGGEAMGEHLDAGVSAAGAHVRDHLLRLLGVPSAAQHMHAGEQAVQVHAPDALHGAAFVAAIGEVCGAPCALAAGPQT